MVDYLLNGSLSVLPFCCTWLIRYCPGFFAAAIASASVENAFLPSFQVIEIWQKVANLKYPILFLSAIVCICAFLCSQFVGLIHVVQYANKAKRCFYG